ncbi:uncharacterized protein LOC124935211 [Impatiens glandulifera]|uniref:uncharacterized protein LOC124935211 n=1 Tax=Impatiens glandulifera TaxID=253017 RepID=UPI001FB0CC75|nr:uncharacterized protein LOC124935211 [Impatiens glandulifera]
MLTKRKVSATVNGKAILITEELFAEALGMPNTSLDLKIDLTAAESNAVRLVISFSDQDLVIHSSRRNKLKPEYRWLLTVIARSLQGRGGKPLPIINILDSESMIEKPEKTIKPKSSRTKSSKGTSSSAPAEEETKKKKPKRKAVETEAPQEPKGRKKAAARKKRTADVFQPTPINTVVPTPVPSNSPRQTESSGSQENKSVSKEEAKVSVHSETSKSPSKRIEEVIANVGLNTSKAIEDVVQDIAKETEEDDVSSRRKPVDEVEIPDQSEEQPVEETAKTADITPPAQEGNLEEQEPSSSARGKTAPENQSAQDGPSDSATIPEGSGQVNKGKGILIEDSTVTGKGTLQTGPQPEVVTGDEVTFTAEQEDEVFEELLRNMNKGANDALAPYLMWVKLRCETKLSDMAPGLSGNRHWDRLIRLEERALQLAHTDLIQPAFSKTAVLLENARLQAVENAFQETKGATLNPIEMRMVERFIAVREKLVQNLDLFDMQWRKGCRSQLNNADLYQSKPFYAVGETSGTAENLEQESSQTAKAPEIDQIKQAVVETVNSCLGSYKTATDERIATAEANLSNSIKSMIDTAMQTLAMAIQIGEMSKVQVSTTQTQIESDTEIAKRLQEEEMEWERVQKEIEDKDFEFAQKCNEEEQANIQKLPPVQPSHSMDTRNKKKRSAVAKVLKRAEQRAVVPVVLNVQPLDEEEEEDFEELNQRKRRATAGSTATPSFRPITAPPLPPP